MEKSPLTRLRVINILLPLLNALLIRRALENRKVENFTQAFSQNKKTVNINPILFSSNLYYISLFAYQYLLFL